MYGWFYKLTCKTAYTEVYKKCNVEQHMQVNVFHNIFATNK